MSQPLLPSSLTAATKKIHYLLICLDLLSNIKQPIQSSYAHPSFFQDNLSADGTVASQQAAFGPLSMLQRVVTWGLPSAPL